MKSALFSLSIIFLNFDFIISFSIWFPGYLDLFNEISVPAPTTNYIVFESFFSIMDDMTLILKIRIKIHPVQNKYEQIYKVIF